MHLTNQTKDKYPVYLHYNYEVLTEQPLNMYLKSLSTVTMKTSTH